MVGRPSVNRALPARIIDRIRDGVPKDQLTPERGDAEVWHLLVSTAASARQRGWTYPEWAHEVTKGSSELGIQAARKYDPTPWRDRSHMDRERALRKAWKTAGEWIESMPPAHTREAALERVGDASEALEAAELDEADRRVMEWAIVEAERLGTDRPALPRRAVMAGTNLPERAVRGALARLCELGWLVCEDRGLPGTLLKRAALYRVCVPAGFAASPHTSGGKDCGAPGEDALKVCGAVAPDHPVAPAIPKPRAAEVGAVPISLPPPRSGDMVLF